jgi:glyoxylase I family protein
MTGTNKTICGGGFHHLAISVKDFEKSLKFYIDGLGFKQVLAWGEGDKRAIMLDTGDGSCMEIFAGGKEQAPVGGFTHVAFNTTNCDVAIGQARKAGAKVTMEAQTVAIPSTPPAEVRIAFCTGPDGETIEFFQRLK